MLFTFGFQGRIAPVVELTPTRLLRPLETELNGPPAITWVDVVVRV